MRSSYRGSVMSALISRLGGLRPRQRQAWRPAHLRRIVQIHFRLERLTLLARHARGRPTIV